MPPFGGAALLQDATEDTDKVYARLVGDAHARRWTDESLLLVSGKAGVLGEAAGAGSDRGGRFGSRQIG